MTALRTKNILVLASFAAAMVTLAVLGPASVRAQGQAREFTVTGNQFAFSPSRSVKSRAPDAIRLFFLSTYNLAS